MGAYDETPESMAPQIAEFIDEGLVNIIGGCCGTTPDFIARYAQMAEGKKPHVVTQRPQYMWLSGLDLLQVDDHVHAPIDSSRLSMWVNGAMWQEAGSSCDLSMRRVMRKPSV